MILLDTNVISEIMKPRCDPAVAAFIDGHPLQDLFLPSLVVAELRYGLRRLPEGRRKDEIAIRLEAFLATGFAERILVFDDACAKGCATARALRERDGRPVQIQDALIGGMALAYGATLATRNLSDFQGYGLSLIDPWQSGP